LSAGINLKKVEIINNTKIEPNLKLGLLVDIIDLILNKVIYTLKYDNSVKFPELYSASLLY